MGADHSADVHRVTAVRVGDAKLELHGARAVYWPQRRALLIADLHLGKADILRRAGIPAPRGSTQADLDRLNGLVSRCGASELWILGDVLHGAQRVAAWSERWLSFRASHAGLRVLALVGNHDRALSGAELGIEIVGEHADLGALRLAHMPESPSPWRGERTPLLCGHLHPCIRLRDLPRQFPAFWQHPGGLVLPAFTSLAGGHRLRLRHGESIHACVDGAVIRVWGTAPSAAP